MELVLNSKQGPRIRVGKRSILNFGGSSYLGLAGHPDIIAAGEEALQRWGLGAPFPTEHGLRTEAHCKADADIARFFCAEDGQLLGSGYVFGLIACGIFAGCRVRLFLDELAHFSLGDGARASGLPIETYRHCDASHLEELLQSRLATGERPVIATDGMYSTLGRVAPLDLLAELAAAYEGHLIVDESHALAVLGTGGRGAAEYHGLGKGRIIRGGSLGKGCGVCGGFLAGDRDLVDRGRVTPAGRGASPGIAAVAAMASTSLEIVDANPALRRILGENARALRNGMADLGLQVDGAETPVAAFATGSWDDHQRLKARLMDNDVFVYHSTYRARAKSGVIRCTAMANHRAEHISAFLDALRHAL